jgi:hypothetical protein
LAPFTISSWVTDSSLSAPVVMNTVSVFAWSVAKGDGGSPSALTTAPQAASFNAAPSCDQLLASALL